MLGAITIDAPGNYFSSFGNKVPQGSHFLVIYDQALVSTETTDLLSWENPFFGWHV
jgi:hypothetical protein